LVQWTGHPHRKKHLKLVKPVGINLESTDTHLIKATKIAQYITRDNKIAIENSKTGKVTAVVAIMSIFGKKHGNSQSANLQKLLIKPKK
jgi:hypothetical protein